MLCISHMITDVWTAVKTNRRDVEKILRNDEKQRCARHYVFPCKSLRCPTAVGVSLFSGASDLIAVFVHTPTLAGASMTLGRFKVAFVGASRKVGACRKTETRHIRHPNAALTVFLLNADS